MEATTATLFTFGAAALLASWVVLLFVSWKEDYAWGLCALFLPPFAYLYGLFQWSLAKDALLLALGGWVLIFLAMA